MPATLKVLKRFRFNSRGVSRAFKPKDTIKPQEFPGLIEGWQRAGLVSKG